MRLDSDGEIGSNEFETPTGGRDLRDGDGRVSGIFYSDGHNQAAANIDASEVGAGHRKRPIGWGSRD